MLHTTFAKLREAGACKDRYKIFAQKMGGMKKYGRDKPIPLTIVLKLMGIDDAVWCLRATIEPCEKLAKFFACDCAARDAGSRADDAWADDAWSTAVWSAARSAAKSAGNDAARRADARDDAMSDAWDAARDAEKEWQAIRLKELLEVYSAKAGT